MRRIRAVLIDIDGVLTVSWQPLPGTVAALQRLRGDGYPVALVTNTTLRVPGGAAESHAAARADLFRGFLLTAGRPCQAWLAGHLRPSAAHGCVRVNG